MIPLPAAIAFTGRVTAGLCGRDAQLAEPFAPQPQTEPSVPRTAANWSPTEMPAIYDREPGHPLGVEWPAGVPSPSCPSSLPPQAHTEVIAEMPLFSVASEASQPAEIPVTRARPAILTGTGLSAVPPLPSWPSWPWPQANTMPSERSARAKSGRPRSG